MFKRLLIEILRIADVFMLSRTFSLRIAGPSGISPPLTRAHNAHKCLGLNVIFL